MRPAVTRRVGASVAILGLLATFAVTPVLAAAISVNSLADTAADDGVCTLREAITAANTDCASGVSAGECAAGAGADTITFGVAGTITPASPLAALSTDLSISGAGVITVSGASASRVFTIAAGTVALSGLTITGGVVGSDGGGISNDGTLTVTNSTISGSAGFFLGGGILNNGTLTVMNSTISGNAAGDGGGIVNAGTLTVTNSTISGNAAGDGGGIVNDGTLTVTTSTISGNTADVGGGIVNAGTLTVTNSTISGNLTTGAVGHGGGIWSNGTLTVANSTISGNHAFTSSGGIENHGTLSLTNSTISGNSAGNGGGITAVGTETLVNAIVAGNTATIGIHPDIVDAAETITTSVVGIPVGKTLADILVPAGLAANGGPTQTIALALVAGNPAIDLGTGATCAAAPVNALDQRGTPRPAACDIGAYEAQPPTVAAHANVSVPATSAAGAVVTYTAPAGTDEQGGVAGVACLPASGSTFPPGATTVTCTATDAVGHTASGTSQVLVGAFGPATTTPSPTTSPTPSNALLPNTAAVTGTNEMPGLPLIHGLLGVLGFAALRRGRAHSGLRRN